MRRTLYRKLILIYVILAIAGFTLISTVGSRMVEDSLVSSASTSLYREATQIASKQGDLYYHRAFPDGSLQFAQCTGFLSQFPDLAHQRRRGNSAEHGSCTR